MRRIPLLQRDVVIASGPPSGVHITMKPSLAIASMLFLAAGCAATTDDTSQGSAAEHVASSEADNDVEQDSDALAAARLRLLAGDWRIFQSSNMRYDLECSAPAGAGQPGSERCVYAAKCPQQDLTAQGGASNARYTLSTDGRFSVAMYSCDKATAMCNDLSLAESVRQRNASGVARGIGATGTWSVRTAKAYAPFSSAWSAWITFAGRTPEGTSFNEEWYLGDFSSRHLPAKELTRLGVVRESTYPKVGHDMAQRAPLASGRPVQNFSSCKLGATQ